MSHSVSSSSASAPLDAASRLSAGDIAELSKAREARWRPGLSDQPLHSEIFASTADAAGAGVALALARDALRVEASAGDQLADVQDRRQVLWVQEQRAIQRSGRPFLHGLPEDLREKLIHVEAATPEDALFALEEGLRCRDLACVIGEIVGNPRALDFTASRRLSLAAEKYGIALWLVRLEAEPDLSSARMRWRVEPAPSPEPRWNAAAPGDPQWQAELFRARSHAPGKWVMREEGETLLARKPGDNPQNITQPSNDTQYRHDRPGPAFAQAKRFWQRTHSASQTISQTTTPDSRHLVRATVGRSLAAFSRV